jgi:hypothetical protein
LEFLKYSKIERFGNKYNTFSLLDNPEDLIYWEEKIDGAQFRVLIEDDCTVSFGSHHNVLDVTNCDGYWNKCISFISSQLCDKDLSQYVGLMLYGECCIPHTLIYDWTIIPPFVGYDIIRDGIYISYEEKVKIFSELGLPVVPLIKVTTAGELIEKGIGESDIPLSAYGKVLAEGVVLKNYRTQTFLKFVNRRFKEENKVKFGSSGEKAINDVEKFSQKYVTNPRISKKIYELEYEEGLLLDMPMMQLLPKRVWEDIVEECGTEILNQNWVLDLKQCRKTVAARSKAVLETAISTACVANNP